MNMRPDDNWMYGALDEYPEPDNDHYPVRLLIWIVLAGLCWFAIGAVLYVAWALRP